MAADRADGPLRGKMFDGYRIVCVTPAGRRRYMELLVPQVLGSGLVDRYDVWINTDQPADRRFLEGLARFDRVRLVEHPDGAKAGTEAIHAFHRTAIDADTIYIRLDDDVVWLEAGFFETLLRFRIAHPQHFLVMPLIINNALCAHLLQTFGKIDVSRPIGTACFDRTGWGDPDFAVALHTLLLDLIKRGETRRLHFGAHVVAMNRFSINSICWFGRDLAAIGGIVGIEEELEMSAVIPTRLGRTNCFCTDTIAAHFAFFSQRDKLDRTGILEQYAAILAQNSELAALRGQVTELRKSADRTISVTPKPQGGFAPRRTSLLDRWFAPRRKPPRPAKLSRGPSL